MDTKQGAGRIVRILKKSGQQKDVSDMEYASGNGEKCMDLKGLKGSIGKTLC